MSKIAFKLSFVHLSGGLECVGAKANVLHCVGIERWDAALLILLKRWHFVFHSSVRLLSVVSSLGLHITLKYMQQITTCNQLPSVFLLIYKVVT
jgi:hypothetical protein